MSMFQRGYYDGLKDFLNPEYKDNEEYCKGFIHGRWVSVCKAGNL